MGLKWFRARMSLDKPVAATGVPGFYRTTSQFDAEVWPPPPVVIKKPRAVAIPVPPPQIPIQNSMAALNAHENFPENQKDSESSDEDQETQITIPRASVDLLREKNMEETQKSGMRKKKGMAPKPHGYIGRDQNSNEKEMAI